MRYSLLSRFQGALLAAALGDDLGEYGRLQQCQRDQQDKANVQPLNGSEPLTPQAPIHFYHWQPDMIFDRSDTVAGRSPSPRGMIAIACARALLQAGRWQQRQMEQVSTQVAASDRWFKGATAADLAIATLPIMLFLHEDVSKLRRVLLQSVEQWQCANTVPGLLAVGYAIAQVLNERLDLLTLMPQTIAYLKQSTASSSKTLLDLTSKLEQVQTLVQQGAGLRAAATQLQTGLPDQGQGAIALAFYCFLTTPDAAHLAMMRAARVRGASPAACALAGALGGAYNSMTGLPLVWQLAAPAKLRWGMTGTAIGQLAAHLFAVWSGVYDPATLTATAFLSTAPGIIRPR